MIHLWTTLPFMTRQNDGNSVVKDSNIEKVGNYLVPKKN